MTRFWVGRSRLIMRCGTMSDAVRTLNNEIHAVGVLRLALFEEIGDDKDLLADTIEGQTNLREAIAAVMAGIDEDELMLHGINEMGKALGARSSRIKARVDRRRAAIERGMTVAELSKLELPQCTLSIRRVPPSMHITDESKIDRAFWKVQAPTLDRNALKEALKNGVQSDGAHLDNGSQTLAIRRA